MVSAETGGAASGETARNVSRRHTDRCESALAVYSCTDTDTQAAARQSYVLVHDPHTQHGLSQGLRTEHQELRKNTVTPNYLIPYDYSTVSFYTLNLDNLIKVYRPLLLKQTLYCHI